MFNWSDSKEIVMLCVHVDERKDVFYYFYIAVEKMLKNVDNVIIFGACLLKKI